MEVIRLTKELWAIRTQIIADVGKETDILRELRELDTPLVSQPESANEYGVWFPFSWWRLPYFIGSD